MNGKTGEFTAKDWTEAEKNENPDAARLSERTLLIDHALQYADGAPFFLVGDTWLAALTWRLLYTGSQPDPNYTPGSGITFENAVAYIKRQGYNSVSMIAAFPSLGVRSVSRLLTAMKRASLPQCWEKFGVTVGGKDTAKDMHDEHGYRPFEILPNRKGLPNYDAIVPQYFQSIDKKIAYLNAQGFIPMIETTRRDVCEAWKAYFDFNESYGRFVQYMVARYGAYNIIFSKIHLDVTPKPTFKPTAPTGRHIPGLLTSDEFNEALIYHLKKYGPMPFGQPVTTLIDHSTYTSFGHGEDAPWLTMAQHG